MRDGGEPAGPSNQIRANLPIASVYIKVHESGPPNCAPPVCGPPNCEPPGLNCPTNCTPPGCGPQNCTRTGCGL